MIMTRAQKGSTVSVHYTGRLKDDTVFDSSRGGEPLSFTIGTGQIIPGFENGVLGMSPGETKTVVISAEDAYGPYREDQVIDIERTRLPDDLEPEVGQQLQVQQTNGQSAIVTIKEVTDSNVRLDANHPLAGEDLTFEIEMVSVE